MHEKSEMFEVREAGSLNQVGKVKVLNLKKNNVMGDFCGIFYLKFHFKHRFHK